jgi:hypothetical protein
VAFAGASARLVYLRGPGVSALRALYSTSAPPPKITDVTRDDDSAFAPRGQDHGGVGDEERPDE